MCFTRKPYILWFSIFSSNTCQYLTTSHNCIPKNRTLFLSTYILFQSLQPQLNCQCSQLAMRHRERGILFWFVHFADYSYRMGKRWAAFGNVSDVTSPKLYSSKFVYLLALVSLLSEIVAVSRRCRKTDVDRQNLEIEGPQSMVQAYFLFLVYDLFHPSMRTKLNAILVQIMFGLKLCCFYLILKQL